MTTPTPPSRQVDLGREDALVPWAVWFQRASAALTQFHALADGHKPVFRVTLVDGRMFAVTHVQTHVSRGKCFVGTNRWGETDAVCDVITGYTLAGTGPDMRPMTLVLPPDMIASVECVAVAAPSAPDGEDAGDKKKDDKEPFGFAAWKEWTGTLQLEEVEDLHETVVGDRKES